MAMFGEVMPFVTGVGVGLVGVMLTMKFLNPRHHGRGMVHLIGMVIGLFVFGGMAVGATIQFFDPPAPTPVKVAPVAMPGQSPYAPQTPTPSPYK